MYIIGLRRLILWLCVLSVGVAAANSLYVGYRVQRDILINGTLESNRAYAAKLADTTNSMLENSRGVLAYSAQVLGQDFSPATLEQEARRVRHQTHYFNSVVIVDAQAMVQATSPSTLGLVGKRLDTAAARSALQARSPLTTEPYIAATGRWTTGLFHPIVSVDGDFLGYITGSIYLHEPNILHDLLTNQVHRDGSYVFVVGQSGTLLYHPDPSRIGQGVAGLNDVVDMVRAGGAGAASVRNSQGVDMLAGFAAVPKANWGIVVQRSRASTLAPLDALGWRALRNSLPLLGGLLLGVWLLSALIARPLWRMASLVGKMDTGTVGNQLAEVKAWYFEASQLRRALITGLASLHGVITTLTEDSLTDPLTGLLNRRGLDAVMPRLQADAALSVGVLVADIDHFKRVNDAHGHGVGDQVLSRFAALMRENARDTDILCRMGGEEFIMFLPHSNLAQTIAVAQRLRQAVQAAAMPHREPLTVSLGVSHCYELAPSIQAAGRNADAALYSAKQAGRNQVHVARSADSFQLAG